MNVRFVIPLLFLCCQLSFSQEHIPTTLLAPQIPVEHHARERTYDVQHYRLNITLDEKKKTCIGDVMVRLVPLRPLLDTIRLDAAEMKIRNVRLQRKELEYTHSGETLTIALDHPYGTQDTLDLTISYAVSNPRKGMYFVSPDSGYPNKQYQVWTQGEAEDNHFWFPCYDFPNDFATSEMIATVNERFTTISNGTLLGVVANPEHHTKTYHWLESKPHVSYLISLIAGSYVEVKDSSGSVPISNYVYPSQRDEAAICFGKTAKMIEYFTRRTGIPYPWEKFAQTVVQDFIYGGEENVSAVTLTDYTMHDARAQLDYSSDGLVSHELAHQWWGDLLTCRDWSHAWLNEGFATYFENSFMEHDLGRDAAAKEMLDNQTNIRNSDVGNNRRPTVCSRYINPMDVFDNRIYGKGAVVLNMLRDELGDELFWKSIQYFAKKFAFRNVETNDFKIAIEEATGYNLDWFFDEWLYKAGYPDFHITSQWNSLRRTIDLTVRQTQTTDSLTGIFTMPVDIQVWVHNEPETYRVKISRAVEEFSFPAYQQPQLVLFDKGSKLLKHVKFEKPLDEWVFQLQHAEDAVDRILAVDELEWTPDTTVVLGALQQAAIDDRFWDVRRTAVWALGDVKRTDVSATLLTSYGDRDARVRTASIAALRNYHTVPVLKILQHAFLSDSSYVVEATALRSLAQADSLHRREYCLEALKRESRNEILRSTAIQILGEIGDDTSLATVMSYTKYGNDRNVRIQAVNTLASVWKTRGDVVTSLIGMLKDPSYHVRRAVAAALGNIGNSSALEPLRVLEKEAADPRIAKDARDAIEKILQSQQQTSH